jgi:hypothetical protein
VALEVQEIAKYSKLLKKRRPIKYIFYEAFTPESIATADAPLS